MDPRLRDHLGTIAALDARPEPLRAVALVSGGLDSTLAVRLMQEQGVEVVAVNFDTRCSGAEFERRRQHAAGADADQAAPVPPQIAKASAALKMPVHMHDVGPDYLQLLTRPRYGYGSAANPCTDCRIHLFQRALPLLMEYGAHFLITGEVLGQRPKSQNRRNLEIINRDSGVGGWVLRPLSAKLMPPTVPEQKGWIDRERLLDLCGRSRKVQLEMADAAGLDDVPQPAGGCAYVEQGFATRFFDFLQHNDDEAFGFDDITLMRIGRHFRLNPLARLIVGRDEEQNELLRTWRDTHILLEAADVKTPVGLLDLRRDLDPATLGKVDAAPGFDDELRRELADTLQLAATVVARYADHGNVSRLRMTIRFPPAHGSDGDQPAGRELVVAPADPAAVEPLGLVHAPRRRTQRGTRGKFRRDDLPAATLAALDHRTIREHGEAALSSDPDTGARSPG